MEALALLSRRGAGLADARRLASRMAGLYGCWERRGTLDLAAWAERLLRPMEAGGTPLGQACLRIAGEVARWGGHPYHSAKHHAEVATNAAVLAELTGRLGPPIPPARRALLLTAALAHDFGYEPGQRGSPRFAAEAASAAAMDGIAAECGVAADVRGELRLLILATEPGCRGSLPGGAGGELPGELRALGSQPALARLAAVLSDADLLSSAGLTMRWHRVQVRRLELELGQAIRPADDLGFLDRVVGDRFLSAGAGAFTANLRRIRQEVRVAANG